MTKNEYCEHAILFKILPIYFQFSARKIRKLQFNKKALKSNQLAFITLFLIDKILKIDGATSILMV